MHDDQRASNEQFYDGIARGQWLANQIIGAIFQLGGAYIIGSWQMVIGVALMLWGYGLMISIKLPRKIEPVVTKDWIGNPRAGG